jgi:spermidine synthase
MPPSASASARSPAPIYAGICLLALAALMLEVLLTRIISVIGWYDLAFFVISLAMLGLTAGALLVFVRPDWFGAADVPVRLAQSALCFALSIPVCVALALAQPLLPVRTFMSFVGLLSHGALLSAPFVPAGVTLTLALTRAGLPPGRAYGVDLIGAALGCALVIPALSLLDAPSAAVLAAALAALSAALFARAAARSPWPALAAALVLAALCAVNGGAELPPLRPAFVKTQPEDLAKYMYTRWNSYSRVTVERMESQPPMFWGVGEKMPLESLRRVEQRAIEIDGAAGTVMTRLGSGLAEHDYLAFELTALVHELRPSGAAAVIGVGGGKDVLAAARADHDLIVGIELNDLIVGLHEREMADFSGLASLPAVTLVNDEARSYLARNRATYSLIVMSLIDTWASTGAGAYSLSENGLYTVEAWTTFLRRLAPDGILAVSRWYHHDNPGEIARTVALAFEVAYRNGAARPRDHMLLLQAQTVATLLMSRLPFSAADLERVHALAAERGFNVPMSPTDLPEQPLLRELARQPSRAALQAWTAEQALDLTPPTDDRPFFFNMLRARDWFTDRAKIDQLDLPFLGNLQATQTLLYSVLVSLLLALGALLGPLYLRAREPGESPRADVIAPLGYFALIGLGSGRIDVTSSRRWARGYPLLPAIGIALVTLLLPPLTRACEGAPNAVRIAVSLGLLLPPALGMGLCFPLGLRLSEHAERAAGGEPRLGPWLWGINGAFGVCASGLALMTSMLWGVRFTLLIGAGCYALLPLATISMWAGRKSAKA